jgi:glutathione S-transferase
MNATADGLIQAGVLVRTELSREVAKQWPEYMAQQWTKLRHCLRVLNDDISSSGEQITLGEIATAVALGWVDVRLSEENWRAQNPSLGAWFDRFAQRPSMQQSAPPAA